MKCLSLHEDWHHAGPSIPSKKKETRQKKFGWHNSVLVPLLSDLIRVKNSAVMSVISFQELNEIGGDKGP